MRGLSLGLGLSRKAGGATAPAFTPASLFGASEPGGFFDFTDATSLFTDTAGTTPVSSSGDLVYRANDLSGNGNHWIAVDAASRPTYTVSGANTWLEFSLGDTMTVATSAYNTSNGCMVAIGYRAVSGAKNLSLLWDNSGASATSRAGANAEFSGNFYLDSYNATTGRLTYASGQLATAIVSVGNIGSSARSLRVNGTEQASGGGSVAPASSLNRLYIDCGAGSAFPVVAVIFLGRTATAQEVSDVETWLAAKAGATLA